MKKIGLVFSLILFFSVTSQVSAQWYQQNSGLTNVLLTSCYFIDSLTGWSVGSNGTIVKTTNGGENWFIQNSGSGDLLNSVHFLDSQTGWIVGINGKILKTTDGGNIWFLQNSSTSNQLISICFVNNQTGWIVGKYGTILKTTNGGNNWTSQISGTDYSLYSTYFIDNQTGWAVGYAGIILKTANGGNNWFVQNNSTGDSFNSSFFIDTQIGCIVGNAGRIMKTIDGGENWVSKNSGAIYSLYSVYFTDDQTGWAVGKAGTILNTIDSGENWISQSDSGAWLLSVYFIDNQIGWAVGDRGTILKTNNGGGIYLPVELVSFDAANLRSSINLRWSTATELNNHGFEIERSFDKSTWSTIGFREGKGTTSETQDYTFGDDISEISAQKLYYRLKQIDFNGNFEYSKIVEVEITPTIFSLSQNYPNPFNPSTKISWQSPLSGWQTLKVYDILGNEVATLVNEYRGAGSYEVDFQSSIGSHQLANGVYFYQLRVGDFVETKKMILLK